MLNYRNAWMTLAVGLTSVGLVAALVAWPAVAVLTFLLLATVVAAGTASLTTADGQGLAWRRVTGNGSAVAAAVVGAGGLIDLLGTWGFALVAATAAVCPRMVAWGTRLAAALDEGPPTVQDERTPRVAGPTAPSFPSAGDAPWMVHPIGSMDDQTLCLAWRSSYVALQRACSTGRELTIVQRRQELLDEVERRSARGFSAWLASSPRAAGDPSRYLADDPRARHRPRAEP